MMVGLTTKTPSTTTYIFDVSPAVMSTLSTHDTPWTVWTLNNQASFSMGDANKYWGVFSL